MRINILFSSFEFLFCFDSVGQIKCQSVNVMLVSQHKAQTKVEIHETSYRMIYEEQLTQSRRR